MKYLSDYSGKIMVTVRSCQVNELLKMLSVFVHCVHNKSVKIFQMIFFISIFFIKSNSSVVRIGNKWSHNTVSWPAHLFCIFIWSLIKNERFGNLVELVSRLPGNEIFDHLRSLETVCLKIYCVDTSQQFCGSMKFWHRSRSGSSYPYLWLMVPDPDPAIFISDL